MADDFPVGNPFSGVSFPGPILKNFSNTIVINLGSLDLGTYRFTINGAVVIPPIPVPKQPPFPIVLLQDWRTPTDDFSASANVVADGRTILSHEFNQDNGFSLSGETIFAALDGLGISRETDLTTNIEIRRTGNVAAASA